MGAITPAQKKRIESETHHVLDLILDETVNAHADWATTFGTAQADEMLTRLHRKVGYAVQRGQY